MKSTEICYFYRNVNLIIFKMLYLNALDIHQFCDSYKWLFIPIFNGIPFKGLQVFATILSQLNDLNFLWIRTRLGWDLNQGWPGQILAKHWVYHWSNSLLKSFLYLKRSKLEFDDIPFLDYVRHWWWKVSDWSLKMF